MRLAFRRSSRVCALGLAAVLSGLLLEAQTHSTLHSFANDQGLPIARPLEASDGKIYGTTFTGGLHGQGSVYVLTPDGMGGVTFSTLVSFSGGAEGGYLAAPLIEATDGDFYGTAKAGGEHGLGTVFRVDGAGQVTTVHSFSGPEGGEPSAGLVEGPGGILYGTASRGGSGQYGTAFRLELSGDGFTVLHDFSDREGSPDMGGLVLGSNGRLYGTCYAPTLDGLIFSMAAAGDWRVEHTFFGDDGESPEGGLVEGDDGLFYGTTFGGGSAGFGTFYSMDCGRRIHRHPVVRYGRHRLSRRLVAGRRRELLRSEHGGRCDPRRQRLPADGRG